LKKIYLHIGLEKTGTTAIQGFLNNNRISLSEKFGILFPKFEEDDTAIKSNHRIAKIFVPNKNIAAHHKAVSLITFTQLLENFRQNNNCETLILSSELYSYLTSKEIQALKCSLKNFEVTLILYLRRQDDYLESSYDQHVKQIWLQNRPPIDLEKFHKKTKLNFHQFILNWYDNGFSNIDLKIYNKSKEKDFIYRQFFKNINSSIFDNDIIITKKNNVNPSLSLFHKILITQYLPKIDDPSFRKTIADVIFKHNMFFTNLLKNEVIRSKNYYSKEFKIDLLKKYENSNMQILKMFPNSGYSKNSLFAPVENFPDDLTIKDLSKQQIMFYFFNLVLFFIKNYKK